tara:strand:+ start:204 stop:1202 length:999 start_codon:yes stop_codon:yes gene_type:complete
MKNILVTGADGFIGSHLVETLIKNDFKVRAFCIYNSASSWGWLDHLSIELKKEIDVVLGDIRDPICVKRAMKGCDTVFHLAALVAIPYSYVAPASYIDTNIKGTLNIVESARDLGDISVIHTSTSETYGTAQYVPINEDHPLVGQSPYAASKIGADQLALSYWRSFGTPISVLRPFNTYGPRQSARAVIPTIITQILSGKKKIKLGALTPTRDFNYVEDTCAAFIAIGNNSKTIGKVINAASNFEISIGETANIIISLMNKNIEIITEEERIRPEASEVNRLYGENSLLKKLTDWDPKYSGLEGFKKGLSQTIEWFSNKENLAKYKTGIYII